MQKIRKTAFEQNKLKIITKKFVHNFAIFTTFNRLELLRNKIKINLKTEFISIFAFFLKVKTPKQSYLFKKKIFFNA